MKVYTVEGKKYVTKQELAHACDCTTGKVSITLSRNKDAFSSDDYDVLEGKTLTQFKRLLSLNSKCPSLGLFSAQGAIKMASLLASSDVVATVAEDMGVLYCTRQTASDKTADYKDKLIRNLEQQVKDLRKDKEQLSEDKRRLSRIIDKWCK